jgi:Flp pilus assembly protein TadG
MNGRCLRDDGGSVTVLMCAIVLICVGLAGFVVEIGTKLDAASKADTYSAEAARAATIAIGPVPTNNVLAAEQAAAAARSYLSSAGVTGTAVVTGPATVQVTVTVTEPSPLLGVQVSETRTHTAQLQVGVTAGEGVG